MYVTEKHFIMEHYKLSWSWDKGRVCSNTDDTVNIYTRVHKASGKFLIYMDMHVTASGH